MAPPRSPVPPPALPPMRAIQKFPAPPTRFGGQPVQRAVPTGAADGYKLVIGAYLDPGTAGKALPPELAGHSFVAIQQPGRRREAFGFSPAMSPRPPASAQARCRPCRVPSTTSSDGIAPMPPTRLTAPPPPSPFAKPRGPAAQMRPAGRSGVLQGAFRGAIRLIQPSGGPGGASRLPDGLTLPSGGGVPLPEPVRQKMEGFFKTDFSDVRIHIGSQAPAIGAIAFTIGSQIFFAPGQYQPGSPNGQALLGHELTHVVQQRAGRVRNPFGGGIAVVQDNMLEREADEMGRRAALS